MPPFPQDAAHLEPFKKQLYSQMHNFQREVQKMQNQQRQMMRSYQKEIDQL
jgi:hypothetical protein